jgi:hypothetical protein
LRTRMRIQWLWCAALAALLGGGWHSWFLPSDWIITHWLFNYDIEFVRRGLMGAALRLPSNPTPITVAVVSIILLLVTSLMLCAFVYDSWKPSPAAVPFAIATTTFPGALTEFAFDIGRFDQLNICLFVLSTWFAVKVDQSMKGYAVLAASTVLGALIHEAYLFTHLPVVVSLLLYRERRVSSGIVVVSAVAAVSALLVWRFGDLSGLERGSLVLLLSDRHGLGIQAVYDSTAPLYRDPGSSLTHATGLLFNRLSSWQAGVALLVAVVWAFYPIRAFRSFWWAAPARERLWLWLPMLAAFSPLLLSFAATDTFRWVALTVLNLCMMTSALARSGSSSRQPVPAPLSILLLALAALIVGPLGTDTPLPRFQ